MTPPPTPPSPTQKPLNPLGQPAGAPGMVSYGSNSVLDPASNPLMSTSIVWDNVGTQITIKNALDRLVAGRFKANSEYWTVVNMADAAGYTESQAINIAYEAMVVAQANPDVFPTWWDALAGMPVREKGGGGGGGPTSSTVRSVNISSPTEALAVGDEAWVRELGRNMNKKEAKAFQAALNKMQEQNPTVTQSNSSGGANNFTSVRTQGGFNPQIYAQDFARSQEGYSERFAATNFMSLIDRALSTSPGVDAPPSLKGDL
jgi:hypothetical protein